MKRKQYRRFLKYVFDSHIKDRITKDRLIREPWQERHAYWDLILRLSRHLRTHGHLDSSFTNRNVADVIRYVYMISLTTGFLDALDEYFDAIVDDMDIDDLPLEEIKILEELGSKDPQSELLAHIATVKARSRRLPTNSEPISQEFEHVVDALYKEAGADKSEKAPDRPRGWFSGLGKIVTGAGITFGNIGVVAGLLPLPIVGQAATIGSLISSATGIGTICEGFGKLRGE